MPTTIEMQGAIKVKLLADLYLPRAMESRELLKIFPMNKVNETDLIYERRQIQTGLQYARGVDGKTNPVKKWGTDQYRVSPGYYGDHWTITESELVNLREPGSWEQFESVSAHVARGTEHLVKRFLDRCEYSIAQILTTGSYSAGNVEGAEKHNDIFSVDQYTPSTLFSDEANSIPLTYLRNLVATLELGKSVNFRKGFMLMSRPTVNLILKNSNAADLNGVRLQYGSTIKNVDDLNDLMLSNDLPPVKVYDAGYYADPPGTAPTFNRFITNGKIVMVGVRDDGEQVGEYRLTRAAQNGSSAPGEWYTVEDRTQKSPPQIILAAGHNGGPVAYYPEGIAIVNAAASGDADFNPATPD